MDPLLADIEATLREPTAHVPLIPTFPKKVDNTMLSTFDACPQKFFWEYCVRRAPVRKSIDLHAGGAYAAGQEVVRNLIYGRARLPLAEAIARAKIEMMRFWSDFETPEGHQKNIHAMMGALDYYWQAFPPEEDYLEICTNAQGEPDTEFTFAHPMDATHPLTGEPLLYCGRFDARVRYGSSIVPLDDKTTKALGAFWAKQWELSGQFMGYTWVLKQYGNPADFAIIRGVAILKRGYNHLEVIQPYQPWQLDDWWRQANMKARSAASYYDAMIHEASTHNTNIEDSRSWRAWPRSYGSACSAWGGCPFIDICTSENPAPYLADLPYREWDPTAKNPLKELENV